MKCSSRRKSAQIYSRAASRPLLRKSRRQFFAVRQMVAIPAHQGGVAGVFKKKLQRRRFDVAVAKDHVGFADEFKESVNRHFSIIGCAIFEARRQKPCQPEN